MFLLTYFRIRNIGLYLPCVSCKIVNHGELRELLRGTPPEWSLCGTSKDPSTPTIHTSLTGLT